MPGASVRFCARLPSSVDASSLEVALADGRRTSACTYAAVGDALLVLAHGAGAGQRHPFMTEVASGLAARGVAVVTFDFPYMHEGRRAPDRAPVLESCFQRVIESVRPRGAPQRLFIGGKSMGGRMATHLAAEGFDGLAGVVVLGYPLHPPGRPDRPRTAHLARVRVPVLIVQGERDPFGTGDELMPAVAEIPAPARLHVVAGGDHSLAVRGRGSRILDPAILDLAAAWMHSR